MTVAYAGDTRALRDASRILRDALKDKSYRSTPLGLEVARYIRWKRSEWGATQETIRDYESVLARLALFFADLELRDFETPVGTERLREAWDHYWGDKAGRTRAKVRSVWVDFFDWAGRDAYIEDPETGERRKAIHGNPARALAAPKRRGVKREPFAGSLVEKVLGAQDYMPDKLGTFLVLRYGVRRAELSRIRFRDLDFERRLLTITGKGEKVRSVEIIEEAFWRYLGEAELELGGRDQNLDSFLVHQRERRGMKTYYWPHKGYVPRSVHTWWYDRLDAAGLVDADTRRGLNMHRGRHTVASEILRKTGSLVAASKILGHEDFGTTEEHYASWDTADSARVLRTIRDEDEDF